jgi:hypothetical protein
MAEPRDLTFTIAIIVGLNGDMGFTALAARLLKFQLTLSDPSEYL